MKQQPVRRLGIKRGLLAAALALGFGLSAGSATAAESLNRDADEILRSMSTFLAGTKSFSVSADISNEFITLDSQKLQLNSHATMVVERPSRFYATRKGRFADAELICDGRKLTVYGKTANAYVQKDFAGTIEQAFSAVENGSGASLAGTDLLALRSLRGTLLRDHQQRLLRKGLRGRRAVSPPGVSHGQGRLADLGEGR